MNPTAHRTVVLGLRVLGALLLVAAGGIHLYLWSTGYDTIDWIGPLFLVNAVGAFVLAVAVLIAPRRLVFWPAAAGALLQIGTLGGLVLSSTVGLFGFVESSAASYYWESVIVESLGFVVLAALAGICRPVRRSSLREDWTEPVRAGG
jgi:fluoride ion exporter CrcB/FEX